VLSSLEDFDGIGRENSLCKQKHSVDWKVETNLKRVKETDKRFHNN
jgi:hypothetical protein